MEAEPGVRPVDGVFCFGVVCWDVVEAVVGVAGSGLGLGGCWGVGSTLGGV